MRSGVRMHIGSNFDNWSNKMGGLDRIFWSCLVSLLLLLLVCAPQAHAADNAQFISQSVPTTMVPGQVYTVSVTMQNTGTTTWVSTSANPYRLGAQNPENNWNWGLNRVEVASPVAPGSTYTFTFNVTAPPTAGTYNFQWGMLIENITWFGSTSPNTVVNVATPVPVNGAQFVSQTVPSSMVAGNVYSVSVTMQNTGNTTWVSTGANPYSLAAENPVNNLIWSAGRAYLSSNVAPGASYTFTFNVMAPSTAGAYNFQWGMVEENVVWFGGLSTNAVVNVIAPVNSAQFVSQSVPSSMVAGTTYSASVTMKNTGNTTWIPTGTNPYRLGSQNPQENATWGTSREYMVTSVAPGASYTFSFSVTPPVTAGVYNFQWEMLTEGLAWFGSTSSNVPVTVTLPVPVSQTISFPNTGGTTFGVPLLLSATASSHLPVTYTSNTPSVCSATTTSAIPVGVGVCIITASQPGNAYYLAAPAVQQTFGFSIGNQTITLASIANRAFSTAPISISASATSGLPVSLSGSGACSVSGATATLVGIGTCTISATQFGSNSYNPAPTANTAFSVTIGSQVISFAAIPTQAISSGSVGATATATSGLAVSFASTTPTVCNISGSSINLLAAGTCSVTASQSGNANFNAAANITRSFTVTKAAQTITFPGISQYGDAVGTFPSLVFAYASSGLPVAITSLTT